MLQVHTDKNYLFFENLYLDIFFKFPSKLTLPGLLDIGKNFSGLDIEFFNLILTSLLNSFVKLLLLRFLLI